MGTLAIVSSDDDSGWIGVTRDAPTCRQFAEGAPILDEEWPARRGET